MKRIEYFTSYGSQNTERTIEIVKNRVEKDNIKTVVVASMSGETGVTFSKALKDLAIVVSHKEMNSSYKQQIIKLGGKAVDKTHLALHMEGMDDVRESFRTFGQGFKVAVEVILIAADKGEVNLYEDVISVGGTGKGADTAIIARATPTKEIFSKDENKKLEIREILAMPLKKKWW
jgi:hypothetical protein